MLLPTLSILTESWISYNVKDKTTYLYAWLSLESRMFSGWSNNLSPSFPSPLIFITPLLSLSLFLSFSPSSSPLLSLSLSPSSSLLLSSPLLSSLPSPGSQHGTVDGRSRRRCSVTPDWHGSRPVSTRLVTSHALGHAPRAAPREMHTRLGY